MVIWLQGVGDQGQWDKRKDCGAAPIPANMVPSTHAPEFKHSLTMVIQNHFRQRHKGLLSFRRLLRIHAKNLKTKGFIKENPGL